MITMNAVIGDAESNFLRDGGFMGDLIRSFDWSETSVGDLSCWPQTLRTALSVCLNSQIVSALYWGPEFLALYNDAHALALAERHPRMLGRPLREVWAEIWDVLGPQLSSVVETGRGFSSDRQRLMMKRNGREEETFWFYSFAPISGEGGNIAGVFVNAIDLTAQVDAERALRTSREDLRKLNEALTQQVADRTAERNGLWQLSCDLMLVAKFDGTITSVNPAWTDVLGRPMETLLGTKLFDLIHPDDLATAIEGAKHIREAGQSLRRFDNRFRHQDGSYRWVTWTADPGDGSIVAVGRDDTAEKAKAEALVQALDQLRQSQKMEAVGQLTGGLAHDFNNLLTAVTGSLELMQARIAQGRINEVDRYVDAAQGAAKRAAALTHRLLAFSRRQTVDPKPTNANRLVTGMEDLIRRTVGPDITVEPIAAAGLWSTFVDASQLENALLNLCINARDAMPGGGRLTIETGNLGLTEQTARGCGLPPGQYVSLCVSDTGVGMPPEVVSHAFDPFFTTKPTGRGTGLGLSMIYGFAKQSGGMVRIDSKVGVGTSVCVYLPRHLDDEAVAEPAPELGDAPRAEHGQTVLVVDDEPTVRMLVKDVLEELGYTAIEEAEGAAGLKVLQSDAHIDLLVTDVGLPGGMNGRQMADAGRMARPGLKVLFITGYAENAALRDQHLEAGMHVLAKPFAMQALASRIKDLLSW